MPKDIKTVREQPGMWTCPITAFGTRTGRGQWWAAGCCLVASLLLMAPASGMAQEEPAPVHWAYSAFFGTGLYRVKDNQSVFVFRIPPRQTVRRASIDDDGKRRYGVEIHYPLTLGLHNVDDLPGILDPDNFGTVSFTPGVTVEIPVSQRWSLRANAHFGWGKETDNHQSAWIYYGSFKSRVLFGGSSVEGAWLSGISYGGYNPDVGERSDLAAFMLGAEIYQPLRRTAGSGAPLRLDWHLTYDWLFDEVDFILPRMGAKAIEDQWELGLALSKGAEPFRLWFIDFQRIGLAVRWSTDGDFRAISLNFRTPFSR